MVAINELLTLCNGLIDSSKPWHLAREISPDGFDSCAYLVTESLRISAILISPVLPRAALTMFDQLDPERNLTRDFRLDDAQWGGLPDGHVVGRPVPLFPRIEAKKL
jgi:methionyl-tRNA synthetase